MRDAVKGPVSASDYGERAAVQRAEAAGWVDLAAERVPLEGSRAPEWSQKHARD